MNRRITLALAACFLALAGLAGAQTTPVIQRVTTNPGGNCATTAPPQYNLQNGFYFACRSTGTSPVNRQQGTWTRVTPPSTVVAGDGVGGFLTATAAQIGAIGLIGITVAPTPAVAGTPAIGSAALPFGSLYLGTAATNNQRILPTTTAAARSFNIGDQGTNGAVAFGDQVDPTKLVLFDTHSATTATTSTFALANTTSKTYTFPDASITVSGATSTDCGTAAGACAGTATSTTVKIVRGTATSTSASPSTVAITGMPSFTSAATYSCVASNATTPANVFSPLTAGYVSGTAVTFTGPNTLTDVIRYVCIGY